MREALADGLRRHARRITALLVVASLYGAARLPPLDDGERARMAARFRFAAFDLPELPAAEPRSVRPVHPSLRHVEAWISSVGADVALVDADGDGLPNDLCHVDPRTDRVVVSPVPGPLGCDLERVTPRPASAWRDLLGADGVRLAGEIAREAAEDLDAAAARAWAARECLRKAGMPHDAPLVIESGAADGWMVPSSGAHSISTIILRVREGGAVAAAVLAGGGEDAGTPAPSIAPPEPAAQGAD